VKTSRLYTVCGSLVAMTAEKKGGCFLNENFYNPAHIINQAANIRVLASQLSMLFVMKNSYY
jgi:hypothetical protein